MTHFLLAAIRLYRRSPLRRLTRCPYAPSCSTYALEMVGEYGAWRGGWLALRRIIRCRPGVTL